MAKYFIDFEFIEGFHKPLFGKRRHFIDLISIGIKCEDGREYYAISTEFNHKDASEWVKKNVIRKLPPRHFNGFNIDEARLWKSNQRIANDILSFVFPELLPMQSVTVDITGTLPTWFVPKKTPEFYGYYSDYDWVLFCSLFGTMMELPKGFPMYCIDLKQILDEKIGNNKLSKFGWDIKTSDACQTLEQKLMVVKSSITYPKQSDEHNALADANWNYELYKFLQRI